jgi:integrase
MLAKLRRFWADRPLSAVNGASQREYEDGRRRGLYSENKVVRTRLPGFRGLAPGVAGNATLAREIGALNGAISWAARTGLIRASEKVVLVTLPGSVRRGAALSAMEAEELMRLAAETSVGKARLTRIHRFVWLACVTGVRCEALEKLRWEQVDWDAGSTGVIDFREAGRRETKKVRPVQPISPRLVDMLRQAWSERVGVFVLDGGKIHDAWIDFRARTPWARADLHRHDLRSAAITGALAKGMPVGKASVFFGVTIGVIERHYLRPGADFLADVHGYI